jgi:hypothetical protein
MPKILPIPMRVVVEGNTIDIAPMLAADGLYHPASELEIRACVRYAYEHSYTLRVRGSGHSVPKAIYTAQYNAEALENYTPSYLASVYADNFDPIPSPPCEINLLLDKYRAILSPIPKRGSTENTPLDSCTVRVEAGCNLGYDPYDPTQTSDYQNSLLYNLDKNGWALPDLGGISHQTVGGFLSTGSSGGSLQYSLDDAIVRICIVDGTGAVHECSETENADLFYAAGVSMGLLGVILWVEFCCEPRYNIAGDEYTYSIAKKTYDAPINFFGTQSGGTTGLPSFEEFLYATEYTRLMWWPQKGVEKMVIWQAARIAPTPDFNPKPYEELPWLNALEMNSPYLAEYIGDLFYSLIGLYPKWVDALNMKPWAKWMFNSVLECAFEPIILPTVLNAFNAESLPQNDPDGKQHFQDTWWRGLPMDNQVDDRLLPTEFTELWIPVERTEEVMIALRKFYVQYGLEATGTFSCELYATKPSRFWMSPAFAVNVFRVDIFWFSKNINSPIEYYDRFWQLLKPFDFRAHWGKYLPGKPWLQPHEDGSPESWIPYMRRLYPKWEDFMRLRTQLDPNNIFSTGYWAEHLGIPSSNPRPVVPTPPPMPPRPPKPASAVVEYAISCGVSLILACIAEWILRPTYTFNSVLIAVLLIGSVGIGIGVGIVWFRRCLWLSVALVGLCTLALNVYDFSHDFVWWQWHSVFGLPPALVALLSETFLILSVTYGSAAIQAWIYLRFFSPNARKD